MRVIGKVNGNGGLADVYVDDVKQLVPIDCWNPSPRDRQVLYYKNGLENTQHTIKIVARGSGYTVKARKGYYAAKNTDLH